MESPRAPGRGVRGQATAASGYTYGVWGQSTSISGRGVYGQATATGGDTVGVYGESASIQGRGLMGLATATRGPAYGVEDTPTAPMAAGCTAGPQQDQRHGLRGIWDIPHAAGIGVFGSAGSSTGTTYGMFAQSASSDGRGIYARAAAGSGNTYGVWAQSDSTTGRGVFGQATSSSGSTYGVAGRADSRSAPVCTAMLLPPPATPMACGASP